MILEYLRSSFSASSSQIRSVMPPIRRSGFLALAVAAAAAFLAFLLPLPLPFSRCPLSSPSTNTTTADPASPSRLFTSDELSLYNGSDGSLPILLGILGSVFDVTKGRSHYGPRGSYSHFAGRDASRAFVSGNFTPAGLTDSLAELPAGDVKSIVDWRGFYQRSYTPVGKLIGRYYDGEGNPTKHLRAAEAKAARGKQLEEKEAEEEKKVPSCNSRWSQDEGGEVWCDNSEDGGERYPRLMGRPSSIALTGKMTKRCACVDEKLLEDPGLEVYHGCEHLARRCKV